MAALWAGLARFVSSAALREHSAAQDRNTRVSIAETPAAAAAVWSRSSGLLSQTGNADAELKTRVSFEASDDFRRLARGLGMNTSELLRVMVLTRLYGVDGVARMTQEHLSRAAGEGPQKAPAEA